MDRLRIFLVLGFVALLSVVLAVAGPLAESRELSVADGCLAILAFLTLLPVTLALLTRSVDLLSPLPTLGGLFFAYFVLRGTYVLYGNPSLDELAPALFDRYEQWVTPALILATVGWAAALLGYFAPLGSIAARITPRPSLFDRDAAESRAFVLWVAGLGGKVLQIVRGSYLSFAKPEDLDLSTQSYVDYLSRFSSVALFVLAALAFRGRLSKPGRLVLWTAVLPIELGYGVLTGSRLAMFMPLLLVVLASHYFLRPLRPRHIAALAALLSIVIVPLGSRMRLAVTEVRGAGAVTSFDVQSTVEAARLAGESVRTTVSEDNFLLQALAFTSGRLHGLDSLMVCLMLTPAVHDWASTDVYFLLPAMAVVPRIAWRSKPIMNAVPDFAHRYWGTSTDIQNAVAPSNIGSLYLAWGWWGAVIGMFVLGAFWRYVYDYLRQGRGAAGTVIYLNLLLVMLAIEGDVPSVYAGVIKMGLVMVATVWFLCPSAKTSAQTRAAARVRAVVRA